ncbi:MAG: hypothetical protein RPS47_05560 [Colwellia sp.]
MSFLDSEQKIDLNLTADKPVEVQIDVGLNVLLLASVVVFGAIAYKLVIGVNKNA